MGTETNGKVRWDFVQCSRCALINPKSKNCIACGNPGKPYKQITSGKMLFTIHGSRERSTVLGGRFFHAIGRNTIGWTLFEHGADLPEHGSVPIIGRKFERLLDTKALVAEINRLVSTGERLPTDLRPAFEIDEVRHRACQASLESQRTQPTQ
jgi:hypothetical protein